jgi:hypothetical protein
VAAPTYVTGNPAGTFAYVYQSTGLSVCAIAAIDGSLSPCAPASSGFDPLNGIVISADGAHAFGIHTITIPGSPPTQTSLIDVCTIASDGTLTLCVAQAANTPQATAALAIRNNDLYVASSSGSLYLCPIDGNSMVTGCQTMAVGANTAGLAFIGTTAYLSTGSTTLLACPVNGDGTFGSCATLTDPTFDGTAGMAIR